MRLISIISCTAALFFSAAAAFAQPNCKLQPSQTLMLYPEGQNSDKGLEGAQGPIVSNGYTADMEVMNDKGNIGKIGDNARIDLYFEPDWSKFQDFLKGEVRFSSLYKMYPDSADELLQKTEEFAKVRLETYKRLAK